MTKYCSTCGYGLRDTDKFCAECGTTVAEVASENPPQYSQQPPQNPQEYPTLPQYSAPDPGQADSFDEDYASQEYAAASPQPVPVQPYPPAPPQQALPMVLSQPLQQSPTYTGPFVRTYYSLGAYQQDSARMESLGYRVINVEQVNMTNGCRLTALLVFGIFLMPVLIGIVILLFLPTAFSKKYNVSYVFQPSAASSSLSQPLRPSSTPMTPTVNQPQPAQQPIKKMPMLLQYLIVAGVVLATILCCASPALLQALGSSTPSQANGPWPTDTPYTAPTYPPYTPAPASPVPTGAPNLVIFAPTLGGTRADFPQTYGTATDSSGEMYMATIAGQPVQIMLSFDRPSDSLDGWEHVMVVDVQVPSDRLGSEHWSATTANTIAKAFLPADARFQRTATIHPVSNTNVTEHIYTSKGMAATFTRDLFTNEAGTVLVPAGTLSYTCQALPPATSGYEWCTITIGSY